MLSEPVRWIDLLRAVTGEDEYDIFHFIGHLSEDGLVLGSEIISVSSLITLIQTGNPSLCVINTCSSEAVAEKIAALCRGDIICTIGDIDNDVAITFSVLFYSQILHKDTFREAFSVSSTGDTVFRYLEGKFQSVKRNDALAAKVAKIEDVLIDPFGGNGLVQRVLRLETTIAQYAPLLQSISTRMEGTKTIGSQTFTAIMLVLIFVIIVLAFILFSTANGGSV